MSGAPAADPARMPDSVRFRLAGDLLPPVHVAHQVAERARRATLGCARILYGAEGVPLVLSGHDTRVVAKGHRHAFWLPEDADRDGRVDHLTVHAAAMDGTALAALLAADVAVDGRREHWRACWHWIGSRGDDGAPTELLAAAARWVSLTPYYRPWYAKRRFSEEDMIRRDCAARGLPVPVAVEQLAGGAAPPRWRWRESAPPGNARGTAWRLSFDAPVHGPLALGYGCHFGLGLFGPEPGDA